MDLGVIVAWPDDKLAGAVAERWTEGGRPWRWLPPATLASVRVTMERGVLAVEDAPVTALLWRSPPEVELGAEFDTPDRVFADTEARAFWLAALNLPSLASAIRPDAALMFARSGWQHWRDVLSARGVRLAPLRHGGEREAVWLPYASAMPRAAPAAATIRLLGGATTTGAAFRQVFFAGDPPVCSAPESGADLAAALDAVRVGGLALGALLIDQEGAVIAVDAFPRIDDPAVVRRLLDPLLAVLDSSSGSNASPSTLVRIG
jgi:hypothetical protein